MSEKVIYAVSKFSGVVNGEKIQEVKIGSTENLYKKKDNRIYQHIRRNYYGEALNIWKIKGKESKLNEVEKHIHDIAEDVAFRYDGHENYIFHDDNHDDTYEQFLRRVTNIEGMEEVEKTDWPTFIKPSDRPNYNKGP